MTAYQRALLVAVACLNRTFDNNPDAKYEEFMADLAEDAAGEIAPGQHFLRDALDAAR